MSSMISRAPKVPMAAGAARAKGSNASAARPFCQKAMSVAVRVPVQRRFITTSSANVNPETIPHANPWTTGLAERKLGHEQHESRRHEQRRHAFTPAKPAREENTFGQQREERKARVAEQADGHRRHLDRREKAEPVEREHDAVADEAHIERSMPPRAKTQDAERHGRDRGPARGRSRPATARATCRKGPRSRRARRRRATRQRSAVKRLRGKASCYFRRRPGRRCRSRRRRSRVPQPAEDALAPLR